MRICFISDTHTYHKSVVIPSCDILIHTGDLSYHGRQEEVESFGEWFRQLQIPYKIVGPGNHDKSFERTPENAEKWLGFDKEQFGTCYYLQGESIEIDGLNIYIDGTTPEFGHGWAFNVPRGEDIAAVWAQIPDNTHILGTHGPAYSILDRVFDGEQVGCSDLLARIKQLENLLVHACGHIHEAYGSERIGSTLHVNSSICTIAYNPSNDPIVVDLVKKDDKWTIA